MGWQWGYHKWLCTHYALSLFKIINTEKRIGVSNIKYEIKKAAVAKFGNNVKYIPDYMYYNYTIIIDKGEHHKDYICHLFRTIMWGHN